MPIFVVTHFPANYEPPEDESIVLPPGAGRRIKGVPFGVTEDTAAVLRTLSYLEELGEPGQQTGDEPAGTFVASWEYAAVTPEELLIPPRGEEAPTTASDLSGPEDRMNDPPDPTSAAGEIVAAAYATLVIPPASEPGQQTGDDPVAEPGPSTEKPPKKGKE